MSGQPEASSGAQTGGASLAPASSEKLYSEGHYWSQHPEWVKETPTKQKDFIEGFLAAVDKCGGKSLRICDVGGGAGGTLMETLKLARAARPNVTFTPVLYDIDKDALRYARELHPDLEVRARLFDGSEGPFDIVMLIDVLEHLENPWAMLRAARQASRFLVVRQPLLAGLSTFRHNAYREQRKTLGHIAMFDCRQFLDMAGVCGWKPLNTRLQAEWEWPCSGEKVHASLLKRWLVKWNRELASYLMSGFYLNGSFEHA